MKKLPLIIIGLLTVSSFTFTQAQGTNNKERAEAARVAAQEKRQVANSRIKDLETRIKASEMKFRTAEEQVRFQTDNGELTEQESEERMALINQANKKVEAMKAAVANLKTLVQTNLALSGEG